MTAPRHSAPASAGLALACCVSLTTLAPGAWAQQPATATRAFVVSGHTFMAVVVRDDSAAAEWYGRSLDLREVHRLDAADGRYRIRLLTGEGLTVELQWLRDAGDAPDPHHGFFKVGFSVDDVDAAWQWLRARGVQTDGRIVTDTALAVRTFVFRDPDGNRLQVFARCPSCRP